MHIETALESYRSEQVYGANFQTWDHPIQGILKPMWNETMGQSMFRRVAAHAYGQFHFNKVLTSNAGKITKFGSGLALATLDPMAMMVGTLNWGMRLHNGRTGSGNQVLGAWSTGAKYGNIIGTVAWGLANADNPIKAAGSFALAGMELFNKLEVGEYASKVLGKNIDIKGAALIGTGIGLGISAIKNSHFDKDKMFGKWQPEDFKKKAALDEYFDRLEYVKYKGLYEAAASKALFHEKTNIKAIFKDIDKNKKRIEKLKKQRKKLLTKYDENESAYKSRAAKIDAEIEALTQRGNQMFVGGKYTKAAVAYKKAMESTIYGLSAGATKDEILAAVPDQYKDYFQAFMDVTDESEREKILKEVPDYLKRPLQAAWGIEMEDVKSNRRYFKNHKLPSLGWRGWKPNINLKHVKMKTIQNEGMLLSDFGFYESEKGKAAYEIAPDIDNYDSRSIGFNSTLRLKAEMKGLGVRLSNVSIEKTSAPGFWITADMKQSLEERVEYGSNSIHNGIQSFVANFI
jgi:tetratricopeptide (TPR) repeat protein